VKRATPYLIGGVLLAVVIAWARSPHDLHLADVEGEVITAEAYRTAYVDYLAETGLPDTPARRLAFLDRLVGVKLVVVDARARGLAEHPPVTASIRRAEEKLKLDYYVQRVTLDTIRVTERETRDMFLRMNTQVGARHLYAETREKADALKARLDAGESFKALAREVFDDPVLAENGGSLGWFGFDEMDPAFEDVAYSLPVGAVSDPVRTSRGYSIIQVDDRQPKPIITESEYAAGKDRVQRYVLHRRQSAAKRALVEGIVEDLRVEYHQSGLGKLSGIVERAVEIVGESPTADLLSEPLVSFGRGDARRTWTIGDFREKAQQTSMEQRASVTSEALLRQFISGLLAREEMLRVFETSGWERDAEYQRVSSATFEDVIYEYAYEDLVRSIAIPDDSLRGYFDAHPDEFPGVEFDEVRGDIRGMLTRLHTRGYLRSRVASLRNEYSVTVRPDLLASIELTGKTLSGKTLPVKTPSDNS
jgi:parvulin-like peptidyl-prolyl isomerase